MPVYGVTFDEGARIEPYSFQQDPGMTYQTCSYLKGTRKTWDLLGPTTGPEITTGFETRLYKFVFIIALSIS